MIRSLPVFFCLFISLSLFAQQEDTDRLSKEFHRGRRDALRALMPQKSAAVLFSNSVRNRSNDVDFQFSQDPDFYYLTGYTESDAALILFKEPRNFDGVMSDEILFVRDKNAKQEIWTGKTLGVNGAKEVLGFKSVYKGIELKEFGINWSSLEEVFVIFPDQPNGTKAENADLADLVSYFKEAVAATEVNLNNSGLHSMMSKLREIKSPEELVLLQKAMDITIEGFIEMMQQLKPGMKEYEVQAIIEFHAKKNGAEYMGYPSICGSGPNANILHYTNNRRKGQGGDMMLVDMGAEYHGYTADITRTIPVDGKFSEQERAIYSLVLAAQDSGISMCRTGNSFKASHTAAMAVIAKGLKDLGIIKNENEASLYFMHGTSHYLGLDVHDAGTYAPLKPGVVMTVEPGIYIPEGSPCDRKWWNIGVRIEDDVLVTDGTPIIMTGALPRSISDIEKLMADGD